MSTAELAKEICKLTLRGAKRKACFVLVRPATKSYLSGHCVPKRDSLA